MSTLKLRDCLKRTLLRNCKLGNKDLTSIDHASTLLEALQSCFDKLVDAQLAVDSVSGEEELHIQEIEMESSETLFFKTKTRLVKYIRENKPRPQVPEQQVVVVPPPGDNAPNNIPPTARLRMPQWNIPKFSGDVQKWNSFKDLFQKGIIADPTLGNAQRLQYLMGFVDGPAEQLIRPFEITDANFEKAWELLDKRFGNKSTIVEAHLKTLFGQQILSNESGLRALLDTTTNCIMSLNVLTLPTEHWDHILVYWVVSRLPSSTRRDWRLVQIAADLATYQELEDFLTSRCRSIEAETQSSHREQVSDVRRSNNYNNRGGSQRTSVMPAIAESSYRAVECNYCSNKDHQINSCPGFSKLIYEARLNHVRSNNLCFNCLKGNHSAAYCKSTYCRVCNHRHNTLLHQWISRPVSESRPSEPQQEPPRAANLAMDNADPEQVLLATAIVNVRAFDGSQLPVRALLDSGSQVTFMTEDCMQRLRLKRGFSNMDIAGVGGHETTRPKGIVKATISSRNRIPTSIVVNCYVLKTITSYAPAKMVAAQSWPCFAGLDLADPDYGRFGSIDMLIGADALGGILLEGIIASKNGAPTAQNTILGWVLMGPAQSPRHSMMVSVVPHENDLNASIQKFWEVEELDEQQHVNDDDARCEQIYKDTHRRDDTGRYIVDLPFRENANKLGESRFGAIRRLLAVEKRLQSNPSLKQQYVDFLDEYLELGHMELAPSVSGSSYYLPHHCVLKEESTTTKLRVVFDASASTSTGVSLNQILLVGPKLQSDLVQIVMNFRKHAVAMTSDIAKMYRQILVTDKHQDFQRIVWRRSPTEKIQDYRLRTVTYGTASAAYLAVKSLTQLALDEKHRFGLASHAMLSDFYVDDLMTGADTIKDALKLQGDLIALGNLGGFQLRKWMSNEPNLVASVGPNDRESADVLSLFTDDKTVVKTLGICWRPKVDGFGFRVNKSKLENPTKRAVLSSIAKLFDPLGWLGPCIIIAKVFMQKLWEIKLDWDQPLPDAQQQRWKQFDDELPQLERILIRRWYQTGQFTQVQLHGFADASEIAYGAVVYLRAEQPNGEVSISLISSKTKVAPIKTVSIPRLELCAAELLSRLMTYTHKTLKINNSKCFAWTDSSVVLGWLNKSPNTWSVFVSNRVAKIQGLVEPSMWRHVKSADNPADLLSRGMAPSKLEASSIWWNGPEWLGNREDTWPSTLAPVKFATSLEEKRKTAVSGVVVKQHDMDYLLERFSKLNKLVIVTARAIRCTQIWRKKNTGEDRVLTTSELNGALAHWIRYAQMVEFSDEIECLKKGSALPSRSKMLSLNPFIDESGIMREGGRLQKSNLNFNQMHKAILPPKNKLTELILLDIHERSLHGGVQQMMHKLRSSFWIVGARSIIRSFTHRCMTCFRQKRDTCQQIMGNLPYQRVNPSRPFSVCGVDFAGPIAVRASKCRGRATTTMKGYISVFVCFATKAIHLEAVSDLTSDAFLAAFVRFTARRGPCREMFSDNGLNFVGAKRKLDEMEKQLAKQNCPELRQQLAIKGTDWRFIPPGSPHFGGLWEAGVKSVKFHLRRVIGDTVLTYEELSTTLAGIESCLNSRPLCGISDDIDDLNALTPSHFLIGEEITTVPMPDITEVPMNHLKRWQLVQRQQQDFWKRWRNEYLARLQQRPKWLNANRNIQTGELVVIKDENQPSARWMLGRVICTHPGEDGFVRVVSLKCKSGILRRPICKICPLPIM